MTPNKPYETTSTPWVKEKDEWLMVFGGTFPAVGTILECDGELVQVIAEGVRVTRAFGGGNPREHRNALGTVTWRVVQRPQRWDK